MKILLLPFNIRGYEQYWIASAFLSKSDCVVFDFMKMHYEGVSNRDIEDRLVEEVRKFCPDIVFFQLHGYPLFRGLVFSTLKQMLPSLKLVEWCGDIRSVSSWTFSEFQIDRFPVVDVLLLSNEDVAQHELFKSKGANRVEYLQVGVPSRAPIPDYKCWPYDIVFCGNHYGLQFEGGAPRLEIVRGLLSRYPRVGVFGFGWNQFVNINIPSLPYSQQLDCYASAKVVISHDNVYTARHYFSDRLLYCLASGTCTVARRSKDVNDYFIDGVDALFFDTVSDCFAKIDWALSHPVEAKKIGVNARAKVLANHLWENRVDELLNRIYPSLGGVK